MKLVIDTNIMMAALIKDGLARKIIFFSDIELLSPEFTMDEVYKYKELVLGKSNLTEKEFKVLLSTILEYINIISKSKYEYCLREADMLIGKVDDKDIPVLALALATKNDGIWSDDHHFKKQDKIKILTTQDMIDNFES